MSYFDHVRCSRCGAMLDPESLGGGRGFNCPKCGEELAVQDLFGVAAAFSEEEEAPVTLEDAIPGWSEGAAQRATGARSPAARPASAARRGPLPDNRSLPLRATPPAQRASRGRSSGGEGAPSAMDLMRQMKKGKK